MQPAPLSASLSTAVDNGIYDAAAGEWWNPDSSFHQTRAFLNPVRLGFIKGAFLDGFGLDPRGKKALEIGCGGGILCEEIARLGFERRGSTPRNRRCGPPARTPGRKGSTSGTGSATGESLPFRRKLVRRRLLLRRPGARPRPAAGHLRGRPGPEAGRRVLLRHVQPDLAEPPSRHQDRPGMDALGVHAAPHPRLRDVHQAARDEAAAPRERPRMEGASREPSSTFPSSRLSGSCGGGRGGS